MIFLCSHATFNRDLFCNKVVQLLILYDARKNQTRELANATTNNIFSTLSPLLLFVSMQV
jgi:hypothetical protein